MGIDDIGCIIRHEAWHKISKIPLHNLITLSGRIVGSLKRRSKLHQCYITMDVRQFVELS